MLRLATAIESSVRKRQDSGKNSKYYRFESTFMILILNPDSGLGEIFCFVLFFAQNLQFPGGYIFLPRPRISELHEKPPISPVKHVHSNSSMKYLSSVANLSDSSSTKIYVFQLVVSH
jgi:hypothetical protein